MSNGVVHVGAHHGEEVEGYLSEKRSPIVCFEPQIVNYGFTPPNGVSWIWSALGDHSGMMDLRVPRHLHDRDVLDTQSASGLRLIPERALANGWTPTEFVVWPVSVMRFEDWAQGAKFLDGSCSLLVIDVQGMEMQVLKGFGKFIGGFSEIKVECSEPPLYEGGAAASEVISFLAITGFKQTSPMIQHGDIRFEKED